MSKNKEDTKNIKFESPGSKTVRKLNDNNNSKINTSTASQKFKYTKIIWISIGVIFAVFVGVAITLYIILNRGNKTDIDPPSDIDDDVPSTFIPIHNINDIPKYIKENGPLEMQDEYKIKTNVNDLIYKSKIL